MAQNRLLRGYKKNNNQPVNFINNNLLNNNPIFSNNIFDNNFGRRMALARQEQMNKIKSVNDLGLSAKQIQEYIICPIKVEIEDSNILSKNLDEQKKMMTKKYIETNYWKNRTNRPYKNILKDIDWNKKYNSQKDLLVHKVSKNDKSKIRLKKELSELVDFLEVHDKELKVIFSASKENEYKKEFEYVKKFKYRMKYDPKDFNDLKEFHKEQQRKFDKNQRKLDKLTTRLKEDEDMTKDEIKKIEDEIEQITRKKSKKSKIKKSKKNNERDDVVKLFQIIDKNDKIKEKKKDKIDTNSERKSERKSERNSKDTKSKISQSSKSSRKDVISDLGDEKIIMKKGKDSISLVSNKLKSDKLATFKLKSSNISNTSNTSKSDKSDNKEKKNIYSKFKLKKS